jgi:hypothetical protein
MDRTVTLLVVVVLIGSMGAGTGIGAAASGSGDGPSIQLGVDGEFVTDGERVVSPDPRLTFQVDSQTDIDVIVVRLDGEEVHTAEPNGTSFRRTFDPGFRARNNRVQVIATDENGTTTSQQITVYKDTVPPAIGLTSPFNVTEGYVFPQNVTDADPNISVVGSVSDASTITEFEAKIIGGGSVTTTDLTNGSFSLNTTLGLGNTTLMIQAVDEYGNERYARTRLEVQDEEPPAINVTNWPENGTTSDTVSARVEVTDDVGVESVTVRMEGATDRTLVEQPDTLFGQGRDSISRPVSIELPREGITNVTFNATDMANHSTEIEKTVEYDPITPEEAAVPEFHVNDSASGLIDEDTYHLNATVTNGSISRVVVESTTPWNNPVLSYEVPYSGPPRETVAIDRNLSVGDRTAKIRIQATDEFGTVYDQQWTVDPRNDSHYITTAAPTTTQPTTTQQPSTTTTTAHVEPAITAKQEPPLTPVSQKTVPISPGLVPVALVASAVLVWWRRLNP